jgi:opacity protein-like surface antigen
MRKRSGFVLALLALCTVAPASAQVNLGVCGGLNLASCDIDPSEGALETSNLTGFGFGGVLDYSMNGCIALHLEPMYLQKGTKADWDVFELEDKLAYLEVPVMLKYSFGTREIRPYVIAGPTIGYLLSAKGKVTGGGYSGEEDIKDETKSLDFGLAFGAGVSVPVSNHPIFLEARYAMGLTNINDDPDDPDTDVKTKGIQILAGITFPLGGE